MNHVFVVGRLTRKPELYKTESGKSITSLTLAVPRPYKTGTGEYESDFLECVLWQGIAESTVEYVKKGDLIGIKGHLTSRTKEEEGQVYRTQEVVVERVSFLSPKEKKEATLSLETTE